MALRTAASKAVGVPRDLLRRVDELTHGPTYQLVADLVDLQPDDDVLDVACGSAVFLATYAGHAHRVAGLDLSDTKVELARRRLAERIAAGTAQIVAGDATALPWPDGTFSAVTCMGSIELFPRPQEALAEMGRVLRPAGRAVLTMGSTVDPTVRRRAERLGWSVWTEDDVQRLVHQAGFVDLVISYGRWGGSSRLLGLLIRAMAGTDQGRFVRATKP